MNMETLTETPLTRDEEYEIQREISDRARRLDRCRAVFDVEISESYRACSDGLPSMPARCRIVYQRAGKQEWQVTVYNGNGTVISDLVSDGAWIEAGSKCWHIAYRYSNREARAARWTLSDDERRKREEAGRAMEAELSRALWPVGCAEGHLFLTFELWSWKCYRSPESGEILCRDRSGEPDGKQSPNLWRRLTERVARLHQPGHKRRQHFEEPSCPRVDLVLVLDAALGFAPVRSAIETDAEHSQGALGMELWEEPIALGDELFVPRVYRSLQRLSEEPLLRVSLVPEESIFGVNIPLNIRPVDRTKERVDW